MSICTYTSKTALVQRERTNTNAAAGTKVQLLTQLVAAQAELMYKALLQKGIPTALKMYAGEQVSLNSALIEP